MPSAQYLSKSLKKPIPCAAVFTRGRMNKPTLYLPVHKKACILVRFCPILFKKTSEKSLFNMPHEVVWATATRNMVYIYSSFSTRPLFILTNLHYATISDLTWDRDRTLAISSMDGYISFALFEEGELGEPLPDDCEYAM
jgi:chromatin assembly factor 1 subunit B